jgi:RimJ/RimL family protein N-acetyltransferase
VTNTEIGGICHLRRNKLNPMITTPRLLLRPWRDSDRAPFSAMSADPEVMEFFPEPLSRKESDHVIARIQAHQEKYGFCFFAAEVIGNAAFIGFVGIQHVPFKARFTPAVEIGWRLARRYWNRGLATEAAQAVLNYSFQTLKLEEVVSYAVSGNLRSRRVMEKINMRHDHAGDFDHPLLPVGHSLRRHVLYRLRRSEWRTLQQRATAE